MRGWSSVEEVDAFASGGLDEADAVAGGGDGLRCERVRLTRRPPGAVPERCTIGADELRLPFGSRSAKTEDRQQRFIDTPHLLRAEAPGEVGVPGQ